MIKETRKTKETDNYDEFFDAQRTSVALDKFRDIMKFNGISSHFQWKRKTSTKHTNSVELVLTRQKTTESPIQFRLNFCAYSEIVRVSFMSYMFARW